MGISDTQHTVRRINYTLLMFCLLITIAVLTFVIFSLTRNLDNVAEEKRPAMVRLAWVGVACLGLNVVVLLWIFLRWLRLKLTPTPPLPETPYQDAWREAGKRIQVDENDNPLDDAPPDLWRE